MLFLILEKVSLRTTDKLSPTTLRNYFLYTSHPTQINRTLGKMGKMWALGRPAVYPAGASFPRSHSDLPGRTQDPGRSGRREAHTAEGEDYEAGPQFCSHWLRTPAQTPSARSPVSPAMAVNSSYLTGLAWRSVHSH